MVLKAVRVALFHLNRNIVEFRAMTLDGYTGIPVNLNRNIVEFRVFFRYS